MRSYLVVQEPGIFTQSHLYRTKEDGSPDTERLVGGPPKFIRELAEDLNAYEALKLLVRAREKVEQEDAEAEQERPATATEPRLKSPRRVNKAHAPSWLGPALSRALKARGIRQADAAQIAGVSPTYLNRMLKGALPMQRKVSGALLRHMHMDASDLRAKFGSDDGAE